MRFVHFVNVQARRYLFTLFSSSVHVVFDNYKCKMSRRFRFDFMGFNIYLTHRNNIITTNVFDK